MSGNFSMSDYVDVAERIQDLFDTYPDASLQRIGDPSVMEIDGKSFVVYTAAAYRKPDDPRPGVGTAWEPIPGPTKFTKDSELMNAETAAWGRAICALGLVANRKLASRQEIRARMTEEEQAALDGDAKPARAPATKKAEPTIPTDAVADLARLYAATNWKGDPQFPDDEHGLLRMQLAATGAGNKGDIVSCIRALTQPQANTVRQSLAEARDAK